MTEPTDGEWMVEEDLDGDLWIRIPGHALHICNVEGSCGECYANAYVMAAGKELLNALEPLYQELVRLEVYEDEYTVDGSFLDAARAAIAKAKNLKPNVGQESK